MESNQEENDEQMELVWSDNIEIVWGGGNIKCWKIGGDKKGLEILNSDK